MSFITKFILASVLVLFVASQSFAEIKRLTILHFNDLHGKVEAPKDRGELGGVARLYSIAKEITKENSKRGIDTILLYGGDAFTGTIFSRAFEGGVEIDFFNELGLDAMTIGNHEFDFGPENLEEKISGAKFPVLAANVKYRDGKSFVGGSTVFDTGGLKVGVLGLIGEDVTTSIHPSDIAVFSFEPAIRTAKGLLKGLEEKSDVQIALTHEGVEKDIRLAEKVKGFEAVIGGHDHVKESEHCRLVGKIPVCQTPPHGTYVGRVDLEVDGRDVRVLSTEVLPVSSSVKPDRDIERLIAKYAKIIGEEYGVTVGVAKDLLGHDRTRETPLGDLVADIMRETTSADIAFINSGGIRRPIQKGDITLQDLWEVLPFDNHVVTLTMKGRVVRDVIERSVRNRGGGGFLQVSGVVFQADGGHAKNIFVGGGPLDPKKAYKIVTVDFLAEGGDGYSIFKKRAKLESTGDLIRDVVTGYIKGVKRVTAPKLGRMSGLM